MKFRFVSGEYQTNAGRRLLITYPVLREDGSKRVVRGLHTYDHHRTHTAIGGQPPINRLPVSNLLGHYS